MYRQDLAVSYLLQRCSRCIPQPPPLHLCREVRPPPNECPGYDTKRSDGEVSVMQGLWGIQSTSSLPLPPNLLWPCVVAPDRALSMG